MRDRPVSGSILLERGVEEVRIDINFERSVFNSDDYVVVLSYHSHSQTLL
jgi:hypothetical protein